MSSAKPVLVVGNGKLTYSISVCLLRTKYTVNLFTDDVTEAEISILAHLSDLKNENENDNDVVDDSRLTVSGSFKEDEYEVVILITSEDITIKRNAINELEKKLSPDTIIAVNTESICLDAIQEDAIHAGRIIGLNWTEPAHTTNFLEIITNSSLKGELVDQVAMLAKSWNKDAYIVENFGIRSRLISAMVREAFYLVENGYASVEDIDRACRNDAGYYLPFAGNCRYMDLMGTYAYGMVMKDLNPDLSKEKQLPEFFTEIVKKGGLGMENGKGLYYYTPEEIKHWQMIASEFSYQIEDIINKYPFNYKKKDTNIN